MPSHTTNVSSAAALLPLEQKSTPLTVSIKNLFFSHWGDSILENISLDVPNGEFLAVIGPNGGGKTTFLRLLLGLLTPERGSIQTFGSPPKYSRNHIGYVPQYSTLKTGFPANLLDMVLMGAARPSFWGGSWPKKKKDITKALDLLTFFELGDKAEHSVAALSGGQRQRALIARALMGMPENADTPFLLLLDEPTASIDPAGKHCFYDFLNKLRGKVTIIVVSHELFLASSFFDRIVFINKSLTCLPDNQLTPEVLASIFGDHQHDCPVGDLQHAASSLLHTNCIQKECQTKVHS